jgi:D-alanyl-D-alanine carboxypeptidase
MLFDIASVQKNFQAALALKLVEEGLLALDDPLEKWLPPYPNIDGKITIRQLLSLTSGIADIVPSPKSPWRAGFQSIEFEKIWTWEEILHQLVGPPIFKPGEGCSYSTTNFIVLRLIIEKAARMKQTALFQAKLLQPNHLNQTLADFSKPIPASMPIVHGWCDWRGEGKAEDISGHSLNWAASLAPMLVYSTPGDMVKWTDALFHRKTVLKESTLKAMLSFGGPVQNEPLMKGYGLGVVDINIGALMPSWSGVRCYGHLGNQIGYMTFVGYFPDYGVSLAMMFNRGCDRDSNSAIMAAGGPVFDALFKHLGVKESASKNPDTE